MACPKCGSNVVALRRVTVEIDPTEIGGDLISAAAFKCVEGYLAELSAKTEAHGKPVIGRVILKPVPTEKFRRLLEEPDLFRLEATTSGLPWEPTNGAA